MITPPPPDLPAPAIDSINPNGRPDYAEDPHHCEPPDQTQRPSTRHNPGLGIFHAPGSPRSLSSGSGDEGPGIGDGVAAVAISGDRYRCRVEQGDPVRLDRFPPSVGGGEPAADVLPPPAMQCP